MLAVEFLMAVAVRKPLRVLQRLLRLGGEAVHVHAFQHAGGMPRTKRRIWLTSSRYWPDGGLPAASPSAQLRRFGAEGWV